MTALLIRADRGRDGFAHRIWWSIAVVSGAALAAICIGGSAFGQMVPVPDPDPDDAPTYSAPITQAPPEPPRAIPSFQPPADAPTAPSDDAPNASNANAPKDENPPIGIITAPSGRYALVLNDGTRLFGMPGDRKTVPFECVLGHVEVPMGSIHTIEFVVDVHGAKSHRVRFHNGDVMTGVVGPWENVKFQTQYGELTVPLASMVRMSSTDAAANPPIVAQSSSKPADVSQSLTVRSVGTAVRMAPPPYVEVAPGPVRPLRGPVTPDDDVE
jgi:hypothetical protein